MKQDNLIYPRLVQIAGCLCQEIADSGLPDTCFCGVMPGAAVSLDNMGCDDKCGMAWVRLVTALPSNGTAGNCAGSFTFTGEIGIVRCFEIPEDGEPPSDSALLAATEQQLAEMMAMRRALLCCYDDGDGIIVNQYLPYGPTGAALGGTWQFTAHADSPIMLG